MENIIILETEHETIRTNNKIKIDNSTKFKEFDIERTKFTNDKKNSMIHSLHIQLNLESTITLDIGNITLVGREVQLLKEFLNQ